MLSNRNIGDRELKQMGVSIVWREAEVWEVEGVKNFGPNMVSFIITLVQKRWCGVRAFVPPKDLPTINQIKQALECGQKG